MGKKVGRGGRALRERCILIFMYSVCMYVCMHIIKARAESACICICMRAASGRLGIKTPACIEEGMLDMDMDWLINR